MTEVILRALGADDYDFICCRYCDRYLSRSRAKAGHILCSPCLGAQRGYYSTEVRVDG